MLIAGCLWRQCKGNWPHLNLTWGTPSYFAFLRWRQFSSRLVTVFLGTVLSSKKQIEVSYVFDCENGIALHAIQYKRLSSCGERKVSWVFLIFSGNLGYILKLGRGCPFESRVCLAKSGHLSRYDGPLSNLNYAWQYNTDVSGGQAGDQASFSSWHSDIGIPINFQESGIVPFWNIELHVPLELWSDVRTLSRWRGT